MADSGVHFFVDGAMYYRQLDDLTVNVCVAKKISDERWADYLEGAYAIAQKLRRPPSAAIMHCSHAFPNARQRQLSKDFIAKYYAGRFQRVAITTDSAVIRSAMTAMRWVIPSLAMRAFLPTAIAEAVQWLREDATFNATAALDAWSDALKKLSGNARPT